MKKLLSLLLTLAMLSTMFIVGTTSVSAAAATTTAEETYTTPDMLFVKQVPVAESTDESTGETIPAYTTQTITEMTAATAMNYRTSSNRRWAYMRFEIGDFESISSATLNIKFNSGSAGWLYVMPATAENWNRASAIAAKADEGGNVLSTANEDTLLSFSVSSNAANTSGELDAAYTKSTNAAGTAKSSTAVVSLTGTAQGSSSAPIKLTPSGDRIFTYYTAGGDLVSYLNENLGDSKYVYFAISYYTGSSSSSAAGTPQAPSTHSLALTGERAIEGLGTKIMAEKTATISFTGATDVAYVGKDTTTGEGLEGNQYTGAGDYVLTTNSSMNKDDRLYLRTDLSAYADKEITKVEFKVYNRQHRSGCKTYIARTDATWIADGENEISYDNQPAVDTTVDEMRFNGSSSSNATSTADITSLIENLGTTHNNVLSLRFRSNVYEASDEKAATFFNVGEEGGARLVITYLDELAADETLPAAKTFKFKAEIATEDAQVRLLVGIYDSTGALIDVVASEVLTNGTDTLELPIDLSAYSTAASVKCYFWDGTTLNPFMQPTTANVAATA